MEAEEIIARISELRKDMDYYDGQIHIRINNVQNYLSKEIAENKLSVLGDLAKLTELINNINSKVANDILRLYELIDMLQRDMINRHQSIMKILGEKGLLH